MTEVEGGSSGGVEGTDLVVPFAWSTEVSLGARYSSNVNLIHKILELAEVEGGTMLGIKGADLVVSFTRSTEVGLGAINSGNVDLIHKFHQI